MVTTRLGTLSEGERHALELTALGEPLAQPALDVIYWYFREVPKLTPAVGVADAEKQAAAAAVKG